MMEAGFGDRPSWCAGGPLERDHQIELAANYPTFAARDRPSARFVLGHPDCTLMRMGWKELDALVLGTGLEQQWMSCFDGDDPLVIAVLPGMIIGPRDGAGLLIVRAESSLVGLAKVRIVEEVRSADSCDLPKPQSHILVIARGQQPAALPVKCIDRAAILLRGACSSIA